MSRVPASMEQPSWTYWTIPAVMVFRQEMGRKDYFAPLVTVMNLENRRADSAFWDQPNKGCKKVPFRERWANSVSVVAVSNPSRYRKTDIFPVARTVHFVIFSAK